MFACSRHFHYSARLYIDYCRTGRYRHGWNAISCALWMQSAVRGTLPYRSTIALASDGVYSGNDKSVARGPRLFFLMSFSACAVKLRYIGLSPHHQQSSQDKPSAFLWPTAAQNTHISATCEFGSVPRTRQFAWKAWCSSNTWLQSLDRYQRLALAACTCTQPSQ